jgi:tetratricopeptide (TPR) repeat protein
MKRSAIERHCDKIENPDPIFSFSLCKVSFLFLGITNHSTSGIQPVLTMTHIARENTHAKSRIDTAITALILNEDILPSKIVPSQRTLGRDLPLIEEEDNKGNPAMNKVLSELKSFQKRDFEHCEESTDLADTWNALGLIRLHMQRGDAAQAHSMPLKGILSNTNQHIITSGMPQQPVAIMTDIAEETHHHATRSSKIDEAKTALDKDMLPSSKIVASQRTLGRDVPLIEEGDDTGNPALNKVLSEIKSFQNRDFEHCEESADLAELGNALGLIRLHMQRDAGEARNCHEEALRIYRTICDEDRVSVAVTLDDLGSCYEPLHQKAAVELWIIIGKRCSYSRNKRSMTTTSICRKP